MLFPQRDTIPCAHTAKKGALQNENLQRSHFRLSVEA